MKASTKYYIDYVVIPETNGLISYYQLTRTKDDAILYSNGDINNVFMECWKNGIAYNDVVVL